MKMHSHEIFTKTPFLFKLHNIINPLEIYENCIYSYNKIII